ncbi:RagB/SusD family nutrient uptake outer membrane protein [Mucilaginibacter sp. HC2]|uniref:RagB/SusD family nutrient uptake outer membrane protein n=1 Tax=Mucilaginibacter inviolabilis TaxID=2714892 RepID=UPI00140E77E8|nr:RagB/SusD family nutrient uptake outer membrane protein [Mucilaginibacter inviolabilis]NHA07432.1 RagB/SusD family nutrient uptake outer membrane protein [Mucilaginibacter inviolabilis]
MKKRNILCLLASVVAGSILTQSCKKLDQNTYSVVPIENFYKTPAQIAAGLAPAYAALTPLQTENVFQLNEASTDEMIIPTRGNDWYDGGVHTQLWQHTVDANNSNDNGGWQDLSNGITKCNFVINIINGLSDKPANAPALIAEISVLRDYYLFLMMDLYGNIPVVTSYSTSASLAPVKRADVYAYLESDLLKNVPLLSTDNATSNPAVYGHFNQWAGDMLLAKLYLNAQVYTGTPQWANAAKYAQMVIDSKKYSLQPNFLDNFTYSNRGSVENIFCIPFNYPLIKGNVIQMYTLNYNNNLTFNLTNQPYNGFCAPTVFYRSFTAADVRKKMWLTGQQFTAAGAPIVGTVLSIYVNELSNPADSFKYAGARSVKYQPQPGTGSDGTSNDGVRFRLADAYMMVAEAQLRMGDMANALINVNLIRARAGVPNFTSLSNDDLLAERGREFAWEGWRRNDLIRFEVATGTKYYTGPRSPSKAQDAADNHTFLFPIPQPQINTNPLLKQNPGY